jgi:hypothetical protein
MSLVRIVTLDDTWSDIHATPAALNPLVGRSHPGDAMAIITCVTTPHESVDHTVNYVWHLLERMFPPNACPFQTFLRATRRRRPNRILETFAAQHGPSGKGRSRHHRLRPALRPGGRQRARMRSLPTRAGLSRALRHTSHFGQVLRLQSEIGNRSRSTAHLL